MKFPHRRQLLHWAAGAAALPAVSEVARAQAYRKCPEFFALSIGLSGARDWLRR